MREARTTDRLGDVALMARRTADPTLNRAEQGFVAQFANFDDLMEGTRLFEHIGDLARTCRAHGIQLVILNNAVHPMALQEFPHGRDDHDRFVAALRTAAETNGVPFFDPAPGGVGDPELFQDTIHHNVAGTRWLSEKIAHFLVERGLVGGGPPGASTPSAAR